MRFSASSTVPSVHWPCALQARLAVLDLGDIFKLGGEVCDTAQCAAQRVFLVTVIFGMFALNVRNFRARVSAHGGYAAAVGAGKSYRCDARYRLRHTS